MRVRIKYSDHDTVKLFTPPRQPLLRLQRIIRRWQIKLAKQGLKGAQPFSDDRSESGGEECADLDDYKVVNLHWASDFVDLPSLFQHLSPEIPIVVTMHDMNAFTGGCHYNLDCDRFTGSCGSCPRLGKKKQRDLSRKIWERKRESYQLRDIRKLHFVANSKWTAEQARRSSLLGDLPVSVIHYGLDTNIFRPLSKQFARDVFGIPQDKAVVMFGAASVEDDRKGIQYLNAALNALEIKPFLLSFGAGHPPKELRSEGLHIGVVENEHLLALVYSAADVFVIPSMQEAFGQTILEAMACAVPIVGFDTGGIPDMVENGVSGLLCSKGNTNELSTALSALLSNTELSKTLGMHGRAIVVRRFQLAYQARNYAELYGQLI